MCFPSVLSESLAACGADGVLLTESVAAVSVLHDAVGVVIRTMGEANGMKVLVEHHLPEVAGNVANAAEKGVSLNSGAKVRLTPKEAK